LLIKLRNFLLRRFDQGLRTKGQWQAFTPD
jgi:hypothetical protein